MFWIKKLNLSHQAWPSRSQPHTGNQGPGAPFLELLHEERESRKPARGWGSAGSHVGRLCYSLLARACLPQPGAVRLRARPLCFPGNSGDVASAIPLTRHRSPDPSASPLPEVTQSNQNTVPTLTAVFLWRLNQSQGKAAGRLKSTISSPPLTSRSHWGYGSRQLSHYLTITSLRAETAFSTSLFLPQNLTQRRCSKTPLKLTMNVVTKGERVGEGINWETGTDIYTLLYIK